MSDRGVTDVRHLNGRRAGWAAPLGLRLVELEAIIPVGPSQLCTRHSDEAKSRACAHCICSFASIRVPSQTGIQTVFLNEVSQMLLAIQQRTNSKDTDRKVAGIFLAKS